MQRPTPRFTRPDTLFPYTTLFRSKGAVSLTHEQALVDYDPRVIAPADILTILRDIGYDLYDPRKLRPFEEEEADLVREGQRLLVAVAASLAAIALIANVTGVWSVLVPASVVVRSEEHTSELQSLMRISYAVFCLKKKT